MNKEIITYYEASLNFIGLLDHYIMQCRHITTHVLELELNQCLNIGWRLIKGKASGIVTEGLSSKSIGYNEEEFIINPEAVLSKTECIKNIISFLNKNELKKCVVWEEKNKNNITQELYKEWCVSTIQDYNSYKRDNEAIHNMNMMYNQI